MLFDGECMLAFASKTMRFEYDKYDVTGQNKTTSMNANDPVEADLMS